MTVRLWINGEDYGTMSERIAVLAVAGAKERGEINVRTEPVTDDAPTFLPYLPREGQRKRPVYQEDDALIHGRDPDYHGIHEWWEKTFPGRVFKDDWSAAKETEVDGGDCCTRTLEIPNEKLGDGRKIRLTVTGGVDGFSVDKAEIVEIA